MGAWGFKLYENDTALDVRDEFEEKIRRGESVESVTTQMITEYASIMGIISEEPIFWIAFADTQWRRGMLQQEVKNSALYWIDELIKKNPWQEESIAFQKQQKTMLEEMRHKLLSPQPPIWKPRKRRLYKCEWKIGDVYAYQLDSDLAKERGFLGRYLLIQKVDEDVYYPGHVVPIVYVKITKDTKLPCTVEEYDQLDYIQTCFSKYEERFFPIDGRRPEEDIAEKSKMKYEVDEYGYLPHFRVILLNTSKKVIPSKLIYIGNFVNAMPPKKEFIPHSKINLLTLNWTSFNYTFETRILENYFRHNLREGIMYSKEQK